MSKTRLPVVRLTNGNEISSLNYFRKNAETRESSFDRKPSLNRVSCQSFNENRTKLKQKGKKKSNVRRTKLRSKQISQKIKTLMIRKMKNLMKDPALAIHSN